VQVTVLGSGSALPTHRRASAGYLVEWSGGAVLLDAAAGTYMRALKAGLDPYALRAVALTHFHLDHVADLGGLLWARRQDEKLPGPLRLAGPDGIADVLARALATFPDGWPDPTCEVCGYPFEQDGLLIEAFPAQHSPEAVCLRITADGRTLAFSGDTADCDGVRACCRLADVALLECSAMESKTGHMTPRDCANVIEAACPAHVMLTHIGPDVESDLPMAEDGLVIPV